MTPTFGSVYDQYVAAQDIADSVGWKVCSDITPGVDDWVRLLDAAATVATLRARLEEADRKLEWHDCDALCDVCRIGAEEDAALAQTKEE